VARLQHLVTTRGRHVLADIDLLVAVTRLFVVEVALGDRIGQRHLEVVAHGRRRRRAGALTNPDVPGGQNVTLVVLHVADGAVGRRAGAGPAADGGGVVCRAGGFQA